MKNTARSRFTLGLLVTALLLVALGFQATFAQTIRLPHCCADGSHFDVGAEKFAELLAEKTDGQLEVQVFPGGQLGQETEVIQNVQSGTIEMTMIGHDPLAQFSPITTLLSQPYLFRDHEHAFQVLEGPVGEQIETELADRNLLVLGWGNNGARVYTNNRGPIETPEDVQGLKIRSPQSPVNLAVTEALGGIPVAMPYGEVYTALQQGTIDGQENAVINIYPANLQEVQDYMSMTNHLLSFAVFVMNKDFFESLPAEQQEAVRSAAEEATAFQREYVVDLTDELVQEMEEAGMQVNWPDQAPFREATQPIHEEYIGENFSREMYEAVQQAE